MVPTGLAHGHGPVEGRMAFIRVLQTQCLRGRSKFAWPSGRSWASWEPVALASPVMCVALGVVCGVLFSGQECPGLCQTPDGTCDATFLMASASARHGELLGGLGPPQASPRASHDRHGHGSAPIEWSPAEGRRDKDAVGRCAVARVGGRVMALQAGTPVQR